MFVLTTPSTDLNMQTVLTRFYSPELKAQVNFLIILCMVTNCPSVRLSVRKHDKYFLLQQKHYVLWLKIVRTVLVWFSINNVYILDPHMYKMIGHPYLIQHLFSQQKHGSDIAVTTKTYKYELCI